MAANILSLTTVFILFLISANGRSLQKEIEGKNVNLSHFTSAGNGKLVKAVSRATASTKTNANDVLGLALIVATIPTLAEENDDPCVPPVWSWIECNSAPSPRVTVLNMSNLGLYGELNVDFSVMDALQKIDFSHNSIYGYIPPFLGKFPDLELLNLAYNFFVGAVPNSISCNNNLKLVLTGNTGQITNTCSTSNDSPSSGNSGSGSGLDGGGVQVPTSTRRTKKKSSLPAILGSTISAFVVFWAAVGGYAMHRHRVKTAAAIAEAEAEASSTKQVPEAGANIPTPERPMNPHPRQMSP